jgi:hypothetical protein
MADVLYTVLAKGNIMSTVLITSEEWSALLDSEAKSLKAKDKTYRNKHLPSQKIRQPRQIFCMESEPTRSLRDLISNDEIAALLAPHPIKQSTLARGMARKAKKPLTHISHGIL